MNAKSDDLEGPKAPKIFQKRILERFMEFEPAFL